MHYGTVSVTITQQYLDSLQNQSWFARMFRSSPETHLKVTDLTPLSGAAFFASVQQVMQDARPGEKAALVYIHGFQTTFEEAAQRAGSIGYQLKMPLTSFFSWPSRGRLAAYVADKNAADASASALADYLLSFVRESGAEKVHLIAHSMGNSALLQAVNRPAMQQAIAAGWLKFGQVILAAPDVDQGVFRTDAPELVRIADRVTMYASENDRALTLSKGLADYPRAGLVPPATVVSGIDTLDVSDVNLTLLGHAFVADEIVVLEDMGHLVTRNAPPRMRPRVRPAQDFWCLAMAQPKPQSRCN